MYVTNQVQLHSFGLVGECYMIAIAIAILVSTHCTHIVKEQTADSKK